MRCGGNGMKLVAAFGFGYLARELVHYCFPRYRELWEQREQHLEKLNYSCSKTEPEILEEIPKEQPSHFMIYPFFKVAPKKSEEEVQIKPQQHPPTVTQTPTVLTPCKREIDSNKDRRAGAYLAIGGIAVYLISKHKHRLNNLGRPMRAHNVCWALTKTLLISAPALLAISIKDQARVPEREGWVSAPQTPVIPQSAFP